MSSYFYLGYRRRDGRLFVLPRRLRRRAARIEEADRARFSSALLPPGQTTILIRPFLPSEEEIQQLLENPIRQDHVAMLCYLVPDGGIERKPITAAEKAGWEESLGWWMEVGP